MFCKPINHATRDENEGIAVQHPGSFSHSLDAISPVCAWANLGLTGKNLNYLVRMEIVFWIGVNQKWTWTHACLNMNCKGSTVGQRTVDFFTRVEDKRAVVIVLSFVWLLLVPDSTDKKRHMHQGCEKDQESI